MVGDGTGQRVVKSSIDFSMWAGLVPALFYIVRENKYECYVG